MHASFCLVNEISLDYAALIDIDWTTLECYSYFLDDNTAPPASNFKYDFIFGLFCCFIFGSAPLVSR